MKAVRRSVGHTQETLAERIGVDVTTLQGWESGRRPLMAVSTGQYLRLRHLLRRLGAGPHLLTQLDTALEADRFIGYVLAADHQIDLDGHPLATWVITRPFTDLVAWPFIGVAPTAIAEATPPGRRGPSASGPELAADERQHISAHLRAAAEQAPRDTVKGALLRRQAHYVTGFDTSAETAEWLAAIQGEEKRRLRSTAEWSPSWAVVRSGAHSIARKGDSEALPEFIDAHVSSEECETANLNYWAYWLGEVADPQLADTFMVELSVDTWRGDHLLTHLVGKLDPTNPYVDIVVHSLWALVIRKPGFLDDRNAASMTPTVLRLLDERSVSPRSRRELEAVLYALRMAQRR
nr:helix-turn-helix transcriptional regulator [Nocardiopsis aegyptia]